MGSKRRWRIVIASCSAVLLAVACGSAIAPRPPIVVVYASVDRSIAEPILDRFARRTGIDVRTVYDTEANKAIGLANRIVGERAHPQADVFWNGEFVQTVRLAQKGLLAPTPASIDGSRIRKFHARDAQWHALAGRMRVLLVNRAVLSPTDDPKHIEDLANPRWRGKLAIADPHFGSTGSHLATLLLLWGETRFNRWLSGMRANEVHLFPGNAQVKDAVVAGQVMVGLTDSDDAAEGIATNHQLATLFVRQSDDFAEMMVPSTVALVRGSNNAAPAHQLMTYLLSAEVEQSLTARREVFFGTRRDVLEQASRTQMGDSVPDYFEAAADHSARMIQLVEAAWFATSEK